MKIEIINKDECTKLFETWGKFSSICYNTPEKYAEKVGKSCLDSGHFSGSRGINIKFRISGVSRACIDQMVRAEVGVSKNVMSGRYVDFSDFDYYTPQTLKKYPEALKVYENHMKETQENYKKIVKILNDDGITGEKAFEIARGVAPMNHCSSVVISFTVEALINLMHKRLCVCAQDEIMKVAKEMKKQTLEILPELKEHLVIVCQAYGYCPENEKRTCGLYPRKEEVLQLVKNYQKEKALEKRVK